MPPESGSRATRFLKLAPAGSTQRSEPVVVEEPLEIRLNSESVAVTMRTPGNDVELALGFLHAENIVADPDVVISVAHCDENDNVVEVRTEPDAPGLNPPAQRNFFASSSCGVCGKASIEAVRGYTPSVADDPLRVEPSLLSALAAKLRELQPLFRETGSLHAAALFDASGHALCVREDVGRHNAVDKVVGWALLEERMPLSGHLLLVSGRCGFEIVQKTLAARIPLLAAISGPSSLAIELARESGQTLVGFLRGEEMNVYSGEQRLKIP